MYKIINNAPSQYAKRKSSVIYTAQELYKNSARVQMMMLRTK